MSTEAELRQELLKRIAAKRASITAFMRGVRPRSDRLMKVSVITSSLSAALTAGPALGGEAFTKAAQDGLLLPRASIVWQALCLGAMVVSIVAAVSISLKSSQDVTDRLTTAEAYNAELEGLQTLVELGQFPVHEAVRLYHLYVMKIPFVEDQPVVAT